MLRIFQEAPEFDEFSKFDTETGMLETIPLEEFRAFLPDNYADLIDFNEPIQRIEGKGATIFTGELPETHVRFPRRIYFQITRNCNLKCDYCFIESKKGDTDVPTSAIFDVAEFMGENGLMEVRLTGGEPTIHPDFLDIMHKFNEEQVYVSVATNGMMSRRIIDALCEELNLWLLCSVDGNKETHNRYRPGTFDKIISNLRHIKERNPSSRIRLTTVLTKENKDQMYDLGEICKSVDAESITVIPLRPQVRNPSMLNDMVTAGEFKQVIEDLIEAKDKIGFNFTTTIETDYKEKFFSDPVFRKKSSCAAGREGTNLDYDAKNNQFLVYGCSYSPASDLNAAPELRKPFLAGAFPLDNIPMFLNIWRDESAWTLFRDLSIKSEDCRECEYLANHQCVGSCPIQNVDYDSLSVDGKVLEQLREQITHTGEWYCYKEVIG